MSLHVFLVLLLFPSILIFKKDFGREHTAIPLMPMTALETKRINIDIQKTLPQWRKQFERYGRQYGVPWTLIAAVAYQESKWNNEAVSHTGVRGLMQLTTLTAEHLGIDDREDANQSIQGGSFYLKYLYEKSPKHLASSDRWIQALAGYNIGWAHLRDIHRLARAQQMNAYKWADLKKLLPLKSKEKYKEHFNFGLARGQETVDFVENVLGYYHTLNGKFPERVIQRNIANANSSNLLNQIQFVTN